MSRHCGLGIDLGSTGCRFAVADEHHPPRAVWVPRQFDEELASGGAGDDPVAASLRWKEALGQDAPATAPNAFGPAFAARLLAAGACAAGEVLGQPPARTALCVPAGFSTRQRQVLLRCAEEAGLGGVELVGDAPALAAGGDGGGRSGPVLVYHCGYLGTEIAVVTGGAGRYDVRAARRRMTPSGRQLDGLLAQWVFGAVTGSPASSAAAMRRGVAQVRGQLRAHGRARIRLETPDGRGGDHLVRGEDWSQVVRAAVAATLTDVDAVLAETSLRPGDLAGILLAGGPTAEPCFAEVLTGHLGRPPSRLDAWSAAFGAAVIAAQGPRAPDHAAVVVQEAPNRDGSARTSPGAAHDSPPAASDPVASPTGHAVSSDVPSLAHTLAMRALRRAEALIDQRRFAEAVAMSHQAYADDRDSPEVLAAMIEIHRRAARGQDAPGELPQALGWLLCANGHAPGDRGIRQDLADTYMATARHLLGLNRLAEAAESAAAAARYRPESPEIDRLRAEIRARQAPPKAR
jgi:hypothetical protein